MTRLIQLTAAIARRMGVEEANHPELPELARDVQPEKVLDEIAAIDRRLDGSPTPGGDRWADAPRGD